MGQLRFAFVTVPLVIAGACGSLAPSGGLGNYGAATDSGTLADGNWGGLGGAGGVAGTTGRSASAGSGGAIGLPADCGPPRESAPCRVDSDCRSEYLVCVPPDKTIEICREPDGGADGNPACPAFPELSSAPICPQTVGITSTACAIRYQRPCAADSDCGPAGFSCVAGQCQTPEPAVPCSTAADCPKEWDCYVPCACSGVRETETCEPPFAVFHCPNCVTVEH